MERFFNAEFVLNYMKENNISKTKLCKLCHIGKKKPNRFLQDDLSLRVDILWKLANGMNVDLKELLYKQKQ